MNELDFEGRNVLVVGGSSGIGSGIAQAFRARGAEVCVWGTRARATDYRNERGSDLSGLHYCQLDVTNDEAIAKAKLPFERLDVLVHSQGTVLYQREEFKAEGWDKVMAVNAGSIMRISMRFHDMLEKAHGTMIVVSSIGAFRSTMGNPAYAASKAAAVSLVRTFAKAWASSGVRVNGIAPSLVETKLTKVTMDHPERRARALERIPMGRFGTVPEIASVALFLASPLATYVCGQTIVVDGGLTL